MSDPTDSDAPESAVTLFCQNTDARTAYDVLEKSSTAMDVEGDPGSWTQLRTLHAEGTLVVSRMERAPDSESSRIILGAFQYFRKVETVNQEAKTRVLDTVKTAQTLIGVRVIPHFVSRDDSRWTGLKEAAAAMNGLIFDGDAMRDAEGLVVLGSDGRSAF